MFKNDSKIYTINDLKDFRISHLPKVTNKKIEYYNIPCAFDIETTSFYEDGEKRAILVCWQFGINGKCFVGRTWEEFELFIRVLVNKFKLSNKRYLIIYVHNLAYEFEWIHKRFNIEKVFALRERKPLYFSTENGLIFKCSYLLTNSSLEDVGRNLIRYKVEKAVGKWDYSKKRSPLTALSSDEIEYAVNDIKVVMSLIQEKIEDEKSILKIPLTSTGYVRRHCTNSCLYENEEKKLTSKYWQYRKEVSLLTMDERVYKMCKRVFQGGYTHMCPAYNNKEVKEVSHIDFCSSYPFQLVARNRFPMGIPKWKKIKDKKEFYFYLKHYCCMFDIKFINLQSKVEFDNYISYSHCWEISDDAIINNGRVYSASVLTTSITELDFDIIEKMYSWEKFYISEILYFARDYLPTNFVKSILDLYVTKTELKGVSETIENPEESEYIESEYMRAKAFLNAMYGNTVTDPLRDTILYDDDFDLHLSGFSREKVDFKKSLEKYNNKYDRVLYYPWGIYVTALARHSLFTGIFEFSNYHNPDKPCDYIYADTDSIFCTNFEEHEDYINKYNQWCEDILKKAMNHHGLSFELCKPKNKFGEEKLIGIWEIEQSGKSALKRFTALGAKRYLFEDVKGNLNLTVSGLNKRVCVPYLLKEYKNNDGVFEHFTFDLIIPSEYTGKLTHTYIDEETEGDFLDCDGNLYHYHELASIHLESQEYKMKIAKDYDYFLNEFLERLKI